MNEDPGRELTAEEDARIRSLLASARASEQAPDDVAARLESGLADLAADRAPGGEDGGEAEPGPPRGCRRGGVLPAAAVGVGVVTLAAVSRPQLTGPEGS